MADTDRDLLPEGLGDRLPPSAAMAARVTRAVLDVMDSHGYDRVQPPSIEFEKSLASRMAGVHPRRMFRFTDPLSLRMMALRGDMTPQIARIAATGLAGAARPLRLSRHSGGKRVSKSFTAFVSPLSMAALVSVLASRASGRA